MEKIRWVEPFTPPLDGLIYGLEGDKGKELKFVVDEEIQGTMYGLDPSGIFVKPSEDGLVTLSIPDTIFRHPGSYFIEIHSKTETEIITIARLQLFVSPKI